jgi:hypothetical protein
MYDIFVSYSHRDKDWICSKLLSNLEQHGFTVMIDYRDFKAGSIGVEEMQRGVLESRHVLLVLTPEYVINEWTKFENAMAQSIDPGAIHHKLIPILRRDCVIPPRLGMLHYRDLRTEQEEQWDLLYRDLTV